jgi:hypothetical protein
MNEIRALSPEKQAELIASLDFDELEREMLEHEQVDCPVFHHFGPGVCIRERHMPEGTLILGHRHRVPHINMIVKGIVVVIASGEVNIFVAPHIFVGEADRKVIYPIEDTVWLNVIATNLTTVEEIEAAFIQKAPLLLENATWPL